MPGWLAPDPLPGERYRVCLCQWECGVYHGLGGKLYTVAARDNLWQIAEEQLGDGTRYTEIRELNGLTCNVIRVGMQLVLP